VKHPKAHYIFRFGAALFRESHTCWDDRRAVLQRLIKVDSLETFLARRFPSAKRFGLEGAEATIPGIQAVVDAAAAVVGWGN